MNGFRRITLLTIMLGLALAAVSGCTSSKPIPPPHTEAEPGPWKDVKTSIVFASTDRAVNVTVSVTGHPKGLGYVRKFELFDGGTSIGHRVFPSDKVPQETFILDAETKKLVVEITSTQLGRWRSNPRKVPKR